jgi:hypothetical protein
VIAAAASGAVMLLLRTGLQVRTIPERMFEWALRLVSPAVFEAGLQRFGFDAKGYALQTATLLTVLVLGLVGTVVLARGWSARALFSLGVGLWLIVMLVIMPLTDAGLFASALLDGMWDAVVGYLAVCLTYAACLMLARAVLDGVGARSAPPTSDPSRRAAVLGLASAGAALLGTYLLQFVSLRPRLPTVDVGEPQAAAPTVPVASAATSAADDEPDEPTARGLERTAHTRAGRHADRCADGRQHRVAGSDALPGASTDPGHEAGPGRRHPAGRPSGRRTDRFHHQQRRLLRRDQERCWRPDPRRPLVAAAHRRRGGSADRARLRQPATAAKHRSRAHPGVHQ